MPISRREGPYLVVEHDLFVARFLIGDDDPAVTENGDAHIDLADGSTCYITELIRSGNITEACQLIPTDEHQHLTAADLDQIERRTHL